MLCSFTDVQRVETFEITDVGPLWNKDAFLRIRRDVVVPTVQMGQVEADVEQENDDDHDKKHL